MQERPGIYENVEALEYIIQARTEPFLSSTSLSGRCIMLKG
jgi:hypothetical protein